MVEYYGTTSEVPWLFLLASWIVAMMVVALAYAQWNRAGLRLHLAVRGTKPAPGSPAEDLPEHLMRSAPLPAPIFEGDGLEIELGLDTTGAPRGPARVTGEVGRRLTT